MTRIAKFAAFAACVTLCACRPSATQPPNLVIEDAWARASLPGKPASAAYLTINNSGGADTLVAVASSSGTAEVHSMTMEGGIMRMRKVDSLAIPANSAARLAPGGMHVMLTDLPKPLVSGQRISLTLTFANSPQQTVAAEIRDASGGHG